MHLFLRSIHHACTSTVLQVLYISEGGGFCIFIIFIMIGLGNPMQPTQYYNNYYYYSTNFNSKS